MSSQHKTASGKMPARTLPLPTRSRYAALVKTTHAPNPTSESPLMTTAGEVETAATGFVLELARALHEYGTPAHHLEVALESVARGLGLTAEFFSTPTSIMIGFGHRLEQRVHLLRVEPGEPNLGKLALVDRIVRDVVEGSIGAVEGLRRVHTVKAAPKQWPDWLTLVAFIMASAAVACFLHVEFGDVAGGGSARSRHGGDRACDSVFAHLATSNRATGGVCGDHDCPDGRCLYGLGHRVCDITGRANCATTRTHTYRRTDRTLHSSSGIRYCAP